MGTPDYSDISTCTCHSLHRMRKLFEMGMLGNLAQSLGLSGRGTFRELVQRIREREALRCPYTGHKTGH